MEPVSVEVRGMGDRTCKICHEPEAGQQGPSIAFQWDAWLTSEGAVKLTFPIKNPKATPQTCLFQCYHSIYQRVCHGVLCGQPPESPRPCWGSTPALARATLTSSSFFCKMPWGTVWDCGVERSCSAFPPCHIPLEMLVVVSSPCLWLPGAVDLIVNWEHF